MWCCRANLRISTIRRALKTSDGIRNMFVAQVFKSASRPSVANILFDGDIQRSYMHVSRTCTTQSNLHRHLGESKTNCDSVRSQHYRASLQGQNKPLKCLLTQYIQSIDSRHPDVHTKVNHHRVLPAGHKQDQERP